MSVYEIITDRIIALLEAGTVPWRKPWSGGEGPRNLASGKAYRGINPFMLECAGFGSPWWLTFKQARDRGGSVRKGQKGSPVIFWSRLERRNDAGDRSDLFVLRYYTVFNVEQCDGIAAPSANVSRPFAPIEACSRIVSSYVPGPVIEHREPRAYYRPSTDTVNMPAPESFETAEAYYATVFHELSHSTGSEKRLARKGVTDGALFGSHAYSKEELCAEMGAAFLCGVAGIEPATIDNSAAYIGSWLRRLRGETRWVVEAAAQAQKAADLVLGRSAALASPEDARPHEAAA